MKLVTHNVWGGQRLDNLLALLQDNRAGGIDVMCFQEIFSSPSLTTGVHYKGENKLVLNLFSVIANTLADYVGYFAPTSDNMDVLKGEWADGKNQNKTPTSIGNAIFVLKKHVVEATGDIFVYGNRNSKSEGGTIHSPKSLQYLTARIDGERYNIFNIHGLWNGGGKKDCEIRIIQSKNIVEFMNHFFGKKILCGDFNLDPETKSVADIVLRADLTDLIQKYGITSTRTKEYRHHDNGSLFADYIFTSKDLIIKSFFVNTGDLATGASDHSPLHLECI